MQTTRRGAAAGVTGAAIAAASWVAPARAELLMEFTFVGTVWNVLGENPEHPWGDVELGDEAIFSYIIDVEQPDQSGNPNVGRYDVESIFVAFDSVGVNIDGEDSQGLRIDLVAVGGSQEVDIIARDIFQPQDGVIFELRGFGSLSSDDIPIDFELDDFNIERGVSYGGGDGPLLQAEFDSYSFRVIP
ncbi:MAG: hypothetical protein AB8G96_10005, partial [Phycisphaerales bacterium]